MESIAARIGSSLAQQMQLDEERQEIITFGALALLQNGVTLVALLGGAWLLGTLREAVVATLASSLMRHASGGHHLRTSIRCIVSTTALFLGCGMTGKILAAALFSYPAAVWLLAGGVLLLAALLPVFRYAPVAAETRPLSIPHREHLRRLSRTMAILAAVLALGGALLRAWWVVPALSGLLVQGISLTLPGRRFIDQLDQLLDRMGGE